MADSTVIGIHVAGGVLRRADMVRAEGRTEVKSLTAIPFPARMEGGPGKDWPVLNGSRLVASMPAADVMSRCWALPRAGENKLRQMVTHQLEADLPVPLEEMTWGYRRATGASDGECVVLAQAVRSERVAGYVSNLADTGIDVDVVTTEAEALTGLYRFGLKGTGTAAEALVLAGANEWLVCVFKDGLARTVGRIGVDAERAQSACRECRQMLGGPASAVKRIYWCAAWPAPELAAMLAEVCAVPVEPAEVSEGLVSPGGEPVSAAQLAEYGPAIGLGLAWPGEQREALIRLAGREEKAAAEKAGRWGRLLNRPWTWTAVAAGLLVVAAAIHVGSLHFQAKRMQETIDRGLTNTTGLDELMPKIQAAQRLRDYRIDVEDICATVCAAMKDSITLTSLQLSREHRLTIKGTTKDPKAIFAFADELRKSAKFKNLNPERTSPGQGGDFVISVELTGVKKFSTPALRGGK